MIVPVQLDGSLTRLDVLDIQAARANLEAASKLAAVAGPAATDAEVAAYSYWRGRVLWVMGGKHRSQRSGAHAAFLAAAGSQTSSAVSVSFQQVADVCAGRNNCLD